MPPTALRRVITPPLWLVLALAWTVLSPLLFVVAGVASALTGNRQPVRLVHFILVYLLREAAVIFACGGLWLLSGGGRAIQAERFQRQHYRLLSWLIGGLLADVLRSLRVGVSFDPSPEADRALDDCDRPLIMLSRHAGPGDSFVLVHLLLSRYGRRPRIVMKETLALDPCIDMICHRLPNALIDPSDREQCELRIGELSESMTERSVLLLFPEGGNFSHERRRRSIASLWRQGRGRHAERAEHLKHVMAPRPSGALSALQASPGADVIFSVHTGLGLEAQPMDLWRRPPTGRTLQIRMWLVRAHERPADPEQQVKWLFDWWERLDQWIGERGVEAVEPSDRPGGHRGMHRAAGD